MTELKQIHNVVRFPGRYEHHIKMIYPKENVKNMKAAWEKSLEQSKSFMESESKLMETALDNANKQIDAEIERVKKRIEELNSLSREERAEVLLKEFDEFCKMEEETLKQMSERRKELETEIIAQHKGHKEHHKKNIEEKKAALDMWNNPINGERDNS